MNNQSSRNQVDQEWLLSNADFEAAEGCVSVHGSTTDEYDSVASPASPVKHRGQEEEA